MKGGLSPLGLPTTDKRDVPRTGGRMSGYGNGVIVYHESFPSMKIVSPFSIFIGNLNTQNLEGTFMG